MSGKVNLDRWEPHLAAAKREGVSLAQYAKAHGLSRYTLYAAREWIRKANGKPLPARQSITSRESGKLVPGHSSFAPVKLVGLEAPRSTAVAQLRARLPNGVRMELVGGDAEVVFAAIQALWGR
jgi:hypothetical protein